MRCRVASLILLLGLSTAAGGETIALSGSWRFQLDPNDVGVTEAWYARDLLERLRLPGALQNQGFGDAVTVDTEWTGTAKKELWLNEPRYEKYRRPDNIKVPFCLQPEKHYVGAAWYQRQIKIPRRWHGKHVVLMLERPHWETRIWVDDRFVGRDDSLCTAHEYDLESLSPGEHTLTIRVDNRVIVDVGDWSHSVTDHTQGNWNGIIGRMELAVRPPAWIADLQVYPHVQTKSVTIKGRVATDRRQAGQGKLSLSVDQIAGRKAKTPPPMTKEISWGPDGQAFEFEFPGDGSLQLWDEFDPTLYQLAASLDDGVDERVTTFGVREIMTTPDKLFAINGRKTFLRGTLECCIFPLTGYPPTDVKSWKRIIRICKAHGLNHIRFHSWCPPEAAFVAADELGFYYQVECGVWANPGNGTPIDQWLWNESERVVRAYGNHPSFVLLASGNEPHGPKREEYLNKWVEHWQVKDPRRLYTTASAYPLLPVNDYHVDYHPRGPKGWHGKDYANDVSAHEVPAIVHEMGQWCVYPNFDEIKKYRGPLKPKNFEIFRDSLSEHGMLDQWRDFLHASGKLQVLCYKEEIEAALRTPGVSGIQLLDLHDFPGQGTALVGILDAFWDEKGYVQPAEFRRFYDTTVPLARMEKRVWTTDETFRADVTVAHFGPALLADAVALWELTDASGKTIRRGDFPVRTIPVDRGVKLGTVAFNWGGLRAPGRYRLTVRLEGTRFENDWVLWLYPEVIDTETPKDVLVSASLDESTRARLAAGGKVLLLLTQVPAEFPKGSFAPIFWNRFMFDTQARQTLGLLCDPKHPALKQFPTDSHSQWQWEDIATKSRAIVMDDLPGELQPIVQYIDDWNTNRKLGLVFECRVGEGKLLVCSADLAGNLRSRPPARQLRYSLLRYMASDAFGPKVEVTTEQLGTLYRAPSVLERLGATVTADSAQAEYEARLAIDDDPATIWHTAWDPVAPLPHYLTVDLKNSLPVRGLTYLPRQDMTNGRIADYEVHASTDGASWQQVAAGHWPNDADRKTIRFERSIVARYLRLVAISEVNGQDFVSAAELDIPLE
jgi:beta-galactosidase